MEVQTHDHKDAFVAQNEFTEYTWIRDNVISYLDQRTRQGLYEPSDYWKEELKGFDYMFEASPKLIHRLRHHCFHITGIKHYDYRSSQIDAAQKFSQKLQLLRSQDDDDLFLPESPLLGGFGHIINGDLINIDTLKFYESMIALSKAKILKAIKAKPNAVVVEIGSGWGGFAHYFKTKVPNCTYVMVDFPEVFLFSASYLRNLHKGKSFLFVKSPKDLTHLDFSKKLYDFVFLPQEILTQSLKTKPDLVMNMVSFQEMTTEQVKAYGSFFAGLGTSYIYSHNRDRSKHNNQISSVSEILSTDYVLDRIEVLEGRQYTDVLNVKLNAKSKNINKQQIKVPIKTGKLLKPLQWMIWNFLTDRLRHSLAKSCLSQYEYNAIQSLKDTAVIKKNYDQTSFYKHLVGSPKNLI